ncbi:MAG TPA: FHA domain-containing protein [Ilumatobacteraceae bacterium]|nr:FHA domain-containing protein [Ilumatobacteraceae bacterium]HRB04415.1 FHA domain-containing protein [Ilumatobacteraceae bacterium]
MAYVFCNQCGYRNPPEAAFCSSCGGILDRLGDHTITLAKIDPLLDAPGPDDDIIVDLGNLPMAAASLVLRNGPQAGAALSLEADVTRLGRSTDGEISLDDITVSRRHAEVIRDGNSYLVRDSGSLNGTYVNNVRIDEAPLGQGDELQIGKFRLVFFQKGNG